MTGDFETVPVGTAAALAETRAERDTLRRLLARYGDPVRMANAAEHQEIIDAALASAPPAATLMMQYRDDRRDQTR